MIGSSSQSFLGTNDRESRKGMGVDFGDKQYGLQRGPKVAWSTGVEKVLEHVTSLQTGTKVSPKAMRSLGS